MKSYKYFELNGNEYYSKNYLVSIAIVSRENVDSLKNTIESFIMLSDTSLDNYEFIIKIDSDDVKSLDYLKTLQIPNISIIVSDRLLGYPSMGEFWRDCTSLSRGEYVMVISDDMVISTPDWNKKLKSILVDFKIYFSNFNIINQDKSITNVKDMPVGNNIVNPYKGVGVNYFDFFVPVFPKKLNELWGFISPHALIDNWLRDIAKYLTLKYKIPFYEFIEDIIVTIDNSTPPSPKSLNVYKTYQQYQHSPEFKYCIDKIKNYLNK